MRLRDIEIELLFLMRDLPKTFMNLILSFAPHLPLPLCRRYILPARANNKFCWPRFLQYQLLLY